MSKDANGTYEGYLKNNVWEGKGKVTYSTGAWYEGFFKDGLRHGHGESKMEDGSFYSGDWVNDKV